MKDMTPAVTLLELINDLPPEERQHVDEYIHFLYEETHSPSESALVFDPRYIEYIKEGIREGEQAHQSGDVLDFEEGKKYLEQLLK
ncbi:MAG: hypothetical protein Q8916_09205 [Bacteroidota bacterium]|nr:hypothetical protein [Bacteroidota bacterium]MDP4236679.1 hypothetical protein [Bacteroidota bacterium]